MKYDFQAIEAKWQAYWQEHNTFAAHPPGQAPKYYVLDMFPYPSGAGLHVGHPLGYIASDILARFKWLEGYNVLHPMGFDAFGLPAEQYAIQHGTHPAETTEQNIQTFKRQLGVMGLAYDPNAEFRTSEPSYYKWTQWIFLQLFGSWYNLRAERAEPIDALIRLFEENGTAGVEAATDTAHDFSAAEWKAMSREEQQRILLDYRLAYTAETTVNWCPALGTVLANDEIKDGLSERGGHPVERKPMRQWMLRITAYADRLLEGLDELDWPSSIIEMQKHWIGKSKGAHLAFEIDGREERIEAFTTRPDTLFGVSFLVLAPEHSLLDKLTTEQHREEVEAYANWALNRSERERMAEAKQVTGKFTGAYAIHPFTKENLPIWVADYVLGSYGTGAVMAVPAHDARDHAFASAFALPIREVVAGGADIQNEAYEANEGTIVNSDFLNGLDVPAAIQAVIEHLENEGIGHGEVQYRLRDAIFSRQRYWGAPIPITYAPGSELPEAVSAGELPVLLPEMEDFRPTGTPDSPLSKATDWVNLPDGRRRETDTMPGWACSSWYFFRYADAQNDAQFAGPEKLAYWLPVDFYLGGAEHAVGHLLYARFWSKVLFDLGHVPVEEPFRRLVNQGMIQGRSSLAYKAKEANRFVSANRIDNKELGNYIAVHVDVKLVKDDVLDVDAFRRWMPDYADAEFVTDDDGNFVCGVQVEKMSKRYSNVVNPDDICAAYGADTFRMYEMFLGPLEMHKPWNPDGISGVHNFVKRFWRLFVDDDGALRLTDDPPSQAELKILHQTLKKVREDIEGLSFNTAVSQFMICTNELTKLGTQARTILEPLLIAISPFAPHLAEELWERAGHAPSIRTARFPVHEEQYLKEEVIEYPVQVNGKVRAKASFPADMPKEELERAALEVEDVRRWIEGKPVKKVIVVPGKIVNVVV